MGEVLGKLFVDPTTLPGGENCGGNSTIYNVTQHDDPLGCDQSGFGFVQVLFLLLSYAYVLFVSSNLISDGSELLLLVPSLRGIVGSVVLPVLGAVPDGAIVLFSGLGKDAAKQVSVGVGALAGSTIMLLTLPWFLAVMGGRVDLDSHGHAVYRKPPGARKWKKLTVTGPRSLFKTGVTITYPIRLTSFIMLASAMAYLIIQGPAFAYEHKHDTDKQLASAENPYSLAGMVITFVVFVAYLIYQVKFANVDDAVQRVTKEAIGKKLISISGAFAYEVQEAVRRSSTADETTPLQTQDRLRDFLSTFFTKYDVNRDGTIDKDELKLLFRDLNEDLNKSQLDEMMAHMDTDRSGSIDFDEFTEAMKQFILHSVSEEQRQTLSQSLSPVPMDKVQVQTGAADADTSGVAEEEDEDEDEDEEIPEDLQHMSPAQQQRAIKFRSFWMMTLGTLLVLLFSDPMVDVLDDLGTRMGIPAFYVAFILAPLASNASELIAAYNYALKKTRKTIEISLSTLEGAAVMNNSFCLAIFLIIIYFKSLAWRFSAETISILMIQVLMVGMAQLKTHRLIDGIIIFLFYPLSLVVVYLLENEAGLD